MNEKCLLFQNALCNVQYIKNIGILNLLYSEVRQHLIYHFRLTTHNLSCFFTLTILTKCSHVYCKHAPQVSRKNLTTWLQERQLDKHIQINSN